MKAAWHETAGGTDVLLVGELDDPGPIGESEVLISMRASSLDRVDLYWREGSHGMRLRWPQHVGGRDVAGVVEAVGQSVSDFAVGDRVVASAERTHAGLVLAPASLTLRIPDEVSFESAGCTPTAGRSAYAALVDRARIGPDDTVLVIAAGSGVGSFGLQIASATGCRVIATAGTQAKRSRAEALGADTSLNHYDDGLAEAVLEATSGRGVDVVLDHAGAPVFADCVKAMAPSGRFVTCGVTAGHRAEIHLGHLFVKGLTLMGVGRPTEAEIRVHLESLLAMIGSGLVTPEIYATFGLDDIAAAHEALAGPDCFGKVVLVP